MMVPHIILKKNSIRLLSAMLNIVACVILENP